MTDATNKDAVQPEWARIEADYRAGIKSLRQIATENGITEGAIRKRAKKEDWERDLAGKIQAKADALVRRDAVRTEVRSRVPSEQEIVASNATAIATIQLTQRSDIRRLRNLAIALMEEVEIETADVNLFEELGEILRSEDDKGKDARNDIYKRVISSAGRIDSVKKLSEVLKTLITLEREVYGMAGSVEPPKAPGADSGLSPAEAYQRMVAGGGN